METVALNLADPELELHDPTPNIHLLFIHFDRMFFSTKLASRAVVRWSKRMYSCAGICSYEGKGGLCDVALSEPLLKLRPRKDLVETLLHEMIHAFLFVTGNDRDRDGHGPNFKFHMHRINKAASLNISIYHSFHDEVKLYQTHVWRCNGPCQYNKPYFGIVRRSANRAPSDKDYWWNDHKRKCHGNFIKIKEPEKKNTKSSSKKVISSVGDITKFLDNTNIPVKGTLISKGTIGITQNNITPKSKENIPVFTGKGYTVLSTKRITANSSDSVADTVRNVWLKKHAAISNNNETIEEVTKKVKEIWANKEIKSRQNSVSGTIGNNKQKSRSVVEAPPAKIQKIDDFFKKKTNELLQDLYGKNYSVIVKEDKLVAVENKNPDLLECPICNKHFNSEQINSHIDECLNLEEMKALETETKSESSMSKPLKTSIVIDLTQDVHMVTKEEKDAVDLENETQKCPCCGLVVSKTMEEHLEECLTFFDNNTTIPEEGASTSYNTSTEFDDDILDESQTMNATGTKTPCPVCLDMVELDEMNPHLDRCLLVNS